MIDRSKSFCPPNSGLSDPLPSDLSHSQDSSRVPLIINAVAIFDESFSAVPPAAAAPPSSKFGTDNGAEAKDALEGCKMCFAREPFRSGAKGFDTPRA